MADSKENQHCDLGSDKVNVNFTVLEISPSPGKVLEMCF